MATSSNAPEIRLTAVDRFSNVFSKAEMGMGKLAASSGRLAGVFGKLGAAGAALGGGAALGAIALTIKGVADSIGALEDAAQSIGVTTEALSGLRAAAVFGGVSADALDASLVKLNVRLADAASGGGEASEIFKRIGVSTKDASGELRTTDTVLAEIADRFASYRDGAQKTALATEIFGKAGAKLIPFLNQGSAGIAKLTEEARRAGIVIDSEAASSAARFGDELDKLSQRAEGFKIKVTLPVISSINEMIDRFERAKEATGDFDRALAFAIFGNKPGSGRNDSNSRLAQITAIGEEISSLEKQLQSPALANWFERFFSIGEESAFNRVNGRLQRLRREQRLLIEDDAKLRGPQSRDPLIDQEDARESALFKLLAQSNAPRSGARQPAGAVSNELANYLKGLRERIALAELDAAQEERVTEAQKERIKLQSLLSSAKGQFTKAELDNADALLKRYEIVERGLNLERQSAEWQRESREENTRTIESALARRDSLTQETQALQRQLETMGLSAEQVSALDMAKQREAATSKLRTASLLEELGLSREYQDALRDEAKALLDNADARERVAERERALQGSAQVGIGRALDEYARQASDIAGQTQSVFTRAFQGLEDKLVEFSRTGKLSFRDLADSIIADIQRIIIRQQLLKLFEGTFGKDGLLSSLGSSFGFGGGKALGGSVRAGSVYRVGELGPELFVPPGNGTIIPNKKLGGGGLIVNVNQTINIDSRSDAGTILQAMERAKDLAKAEIADSIRRGGVFARV